MTNPIAIFLGAVVLTGLGLDVVFNNSAASFFLAQKFIDLIEWLAFWR
ncbi:MULTISPECIES: hypothetical protein [unclassified Shimia]|nr:MULTISPECIES: hypothetical protein [unclassified Shimia]MBO9472698.1 hypothetical protein [Shimia sp. R10_1]MDA5556382.1 hypothetical protein [Shimia sp. MMG029]